MNANLPEKCPQMLCAFGRRPKLCFLTKMGLLSLPELLASKKLVFYTTKHMSSYKRKKSSQAFCTAIISSLFFCRALSHHLNAHWVPQIKVPGFTIQSQLSKFFWFPNPFCSAHILKRNFLALFLF
jgi:hypothetical protein